MDGLTELTHAIRRLTDRIEELRDLMAEWIEEFTPEVERDDE